MSKKTHKHTSDQQSQSEKAIQYQEVKEKGKIELAAEVVSIVQQSFSGPLPPPEVLAKYNQIIYNGGERIMLMAEEQSKHRRSLESRALKTDSRNSFLGVTFAFVLGMTTIIMGGIVILKGHSGWGFSMSFVGLASLVGAFIYGTRERRKERESKAETS